MTGMVCTYMGDVCGVCACGADVARVGAGCVCLCMVCVYCVCDVCVCV